MKKVLVTICGRGGSKGVPGKNIKLVNGTHLIGYSIQLANKLKAHLDLDIALSTDAEEIVEVAEKYGLKTDYRRSEDLANDTAGKLPVITDVLRYEEKLRGKKYDLVIDLDITSPLRSVEDILKSIELLDENPEALNIFSVSPAHKNPYFNMVEQAADGFYKLSKSSKNFASRQEAPKVYELNASFYVYKSEFFDEGHTGAITEKSLVYEVPHMCFDVDNPIDFDFLEFLLVNDKLDFEL